LPAAGASDHHYLSCELVRHVRTRARGRGRAGRTGGSDNPCMTLFSIVPIPSTVILTTSPI
jgi:hypothetical protein